MTQINLLPWREHARLEKKIQFFITLGIFAAITLFILLLVHLYFSSLISTANKRLTYLQTTLGEKQREFSVLRDQKKTQVALEAQVKVMSGLRNKSYQAVRLLNALAKIVPETITLEKLDRVDNKLTITGRAQSAIDITQFMKNLTKSEFFYQPVLSKISAPASTGDVDRIFQLEIEQKDPMPK